MPVPSISSAPGLPSSIAGYRIDRLIGEGGMAQVYLAVQERESDYRKTVVVKRILPRLAAEPDFVRWFLNEARISATLNHPKIVKVFDVGRDEAGVPYMIMEYVPGADLDKLIKVHGQLPFGAIYAVIQDVAEAFVYAHSAGPDRAPLVHRDFSPGNLLVRPEGICILGDFGVSKPLSDPNTSTNTDVIKGKIHFFAPETLVHKINDVRTDLFSVGVSMYEAVTGHLPFDGDTHFLVLQRIVAGERRPVRELRPDCPDALVAIIDRLLQINPRERYQSALEILEDLPALPSTSRLELGRLVDDVADRRRSSASMDGVALSTQSGPRPISAPARVAEDSSTGRRDEGSSGSDTTPMVGELDSLRGADPAPSDPRPAMPSSPGVAGADRIAPGGRQPAVVPSRSSSVVPLLGAFAGVVVVGAAGLLVYFLALGPPGTEPVAPAIAHTDDRRVASAAEHEPDVPDETRDPPPLEDAVPGAEDVSPADPSAAPPSTAAEPPQDSSPAAIETAQAATARPTPRRTPSATQTGPSALDEARACLSRGDNRCARDVLAVRARTAQERALLIDLYRQSGQIPQMLDAMQAFVRRFPSAPQTPGYREDLRRYGRF